MWLIIHSYPWTHPHVWLLLASCEVTCDPFQRYLWTPWVAYSCDPHASNHFCPLVNLLVGFSIIGLLVSSLLLAFCERYSCDPSPAVLLVSCEWYSCSPESSYSIPHASNHFWFLVRGLLESSYSQNPMPATTFGFLWGVYLRAVTHRTPRQRHFWLLVRSYWGYLWAVTQFPSPAALLVTCEILLGLLVSSYSIPLASGTFGFLWGVYLRAVTHRTPRQWHFWFLVRSYWGYLWAVTHRTPRQRPILGIPNSHKAPPTHIRPHHRATHS
jgi:hypothetical protein